MRPHGLLGVLVLSGALLLTCAPDVVSQPTTATTTSLRQLSLLAGDRFEVDKDDGRTLRGRLVDASERGIVIRVGDVPTTVPVERIREVRHRIDDSRMNGMLLGGAIGAAVGVGFALSTANTAGTAALSGAEFGGLGMAIGAVVDGRKFTREVVYRSPTAQVGLAPVLTRGRRGLSMVLIF